MEGLGTTYLFVYGTLQHHGPNHHFLGDSVFLGEVVLHGYSLYHLKEGYPGIIPNLDYSVLGELYEVSSNVLSDIDRLESNGFLYQRVEVVVHSIHPPRKLITAQTYVYLHSVAHADQDTRRMAHWRGGDD
jgi:gamma-glutamylcyclotransferase (GGCT)/AIG2-like uncharacterized protein YtfP